MIQFINWLFCIEDPKEEINENLSLYIKQGKFHINEEVYNPADLLHVNTLNIYFINRKMQEQSKINEPINTRLSLKKHNYSFNI